MWDPDALTRRCRTLAEALAARRPTPAEPPKRDAPPAVIHLEVKPCAAKHTASTACRGPPPPACPAAPFGPYRAAKRSAGPFPPPPAGAPRRAPSTGRGASREKAWMYV